MGRDESELPAAVFRLLESLRGAGLRQLPRPRDRDLPVRRGAEEHSGASEPPDACPATAAGATGSPPPARPDSPAIGLQLLAEQVSQCVRCEELAAARTQTVFGVGNPQAELCIFGEAPGFDEDRLGEPFVGKAGQLLDRILAACRLTRQDVYILNVLKCRPPGNRNPQPDEIANCRGYFERQFQIIQPKFICCLGAFAAQSLLNTTASVGRLRGVLHSYGTAQVVVTYHPAYLLRNESAKRDTWQDMKMLMQAMGRPVA